MEISDNVRTLDADLRTVFGSRLRSLVAYGDAGATARAPTPTLAIVDGLTADDLRACAGRVQSWHDAGLATPLILRRDEFGRSLDAFPYEFGAIVADHLVVSGDNPFVGLQVDRADLRRACEIQVRGHLLHLREGYLETCGRSDAVADLVTRSVPPLVTLLRSVARLHGTDPADALAAAALAEKAIAATATFTELIALSKQGRLSSDDARRIYPGYLDSVERLTTYIDRWSHE